MKIVVSPAKTQQNSVKFCDDYTVPLFENKTKLLLDKVKSFNREALGELMTLKGHLLDETYETFLSFEKNEPTHGIRLYTGLVFKGLEELEFSKSQKEYLQEHVRILSAFYGIVRPFDKVRPYRLDMKMKLLEDNLYKFWKPAMENFFEDELIINLASKEFSKLIKKPMVTIEFKEEKLPGVYKMVGTYAKQARGKMLAWMIENNVQTLNEIESFDAFGYSLNRDISEKNILVFTR